jgi:hypothetical protein
LRMLKTVTNFSPAVHVDPGFCAEPAKGIREFLYAGSGYSLFIALLSFCGLDFSRGAVGL